MRMSQEELWTVLKGNPNRWFSVEELSGLTGVNVQSANSGMNSLFKDNKVISQTIFGKNNRTLRVFCFVEKPKVLQDVFSEFQYLKHDGAFRELNTDQLLSLMTIAELRKYKEGMK
jgi:hypothetical protein